MPNAFETPWVTLEVNDVPLSLCNDLGRPNLEMISWRSFYTVLSKVYEYTHHLEILLKCRHSSLVWETEFLHF